MDKAHDPSLDRAVALKVLQPYQLELAKSRALVLWEARAAAALEHPSPGDRLAADSDRKHDGSGR